VRDRYLLFCILIHNFLYTRVQLSSYGSSCKQKHIIVIANVTATRIPGDSIISAVSDRNKNMYVVNHPMFVFLHPVRLVRQVDQSSGNSLWRRHIRRPTIRASLHSIITFYKYIILHRLYTADAVVSGHFPPRLFSA